MRVCALLCPLSLPSLLSGPSWDDDDDDDDKEEDEDEDDEEGGSSSGERGSWSQEQRERE